MFMRTRTTVIMYIPKKENNPPAAMYRKNAIIPISSHRRGRLNSPVPIALAIKANIIPLMEPSPIFEKALFMNGFFSDYLFGSSEMMDSSVIIESLIIGSLMVC